MIKGMEHLSYKLGLLILEKRRLTVDLISVYKYLKGGFSEDQDKLFSVVPNARTRWDAHKLEHKRFQQNIREQFFTVRVTSALEQVPWRVCRVSLPGDLQKPPGPGQPDLGGPA